MKELRIALVEPAHLTTTPIKHVFPDGAINHAQQTPLIVARLFQSVDILESLPVPLFVSEKDDLFHSRYRPRLIYSTVVLPSMHRRFIRIIKAETMPIHQFKLIISIATHWRRTKRPRDQGIYLGRSKQREEGILESRILCRMADSSIQLPIGESNADLRYGAISLPRGI